MRDQVAPILLRASERGELPVVDAASCTEGLTGMLADEGLEVVDAAVFIEATVVHLLSPHDESPRSSSTPHARPPGSGSIPLCCASLPRPPNRSYSRTTGAAARSRVTAASSTPSSRPPRPPPVESRDVARHAAPAHVSVNRTCELGMSRATGHPYRHVLEVLEEAIRQEKR
jgi:D-lactate dehydrogenase